MNAAELIMQAIVRRQTSFNALSALECMAMNLDTPLIDDHNLREFQGAMLAVDQNVAMMEIKAQKRAINAARRAKEKAQKAQKAQDSGFKMQGLKLAAVPHVEITEEDVRACR